MTGFVYSDSFYLNPPILDIEVELHNPAGQYMFFRKSQCSLENALNGKPIQFKIPNAPEYVRQFFLEKEKPSSKNSPKKGRLSLKNFLKYFKRKF